MSDKKLTIRQQQVLLLSEGGKSYALRDLSNLLIATQSEVPSIPTLRRDIAALCDLGFLKQTGSKKSSRYALNPEKIIFTPIDAHQYCQIDIDTRPGNKQFSFELFSNIPESVFNAAELAQLQNATEKYSQSSAGSSLTLRRKELERFVIELSWKSSKIEGNTYTLLDTELLIREGLEASGHSREEAVMILNHKKAFDFILKLHPEFLHPSLLLVIEIHRLLTAELGIASELRSRLMGITGSLYRPLQVPTQIEEACRELLSVVARLKEPYCKALLALAGISYIQPFEDGNKRTSRLTANAILLAAGCAPLSYRSISEIGYREAIMTFYEKNTIVPLKKLFIEQYIFACENYLQFV